MGANSYETTFKFLDKREYKGTDNMIEIVNADTIDMESGQAIKGGLFDEEAFGTSWRELGKDYHGEEDWISFFSDSDIDQMGKGGYIKLATPINWGLARGKSEYSDPLCLDVIGVLPPAMRPIVKVEDKYISHPLNDAYLRILTTNNRIKALLGNKAPNIVIYNEQRMLANQVYELFKLIDAINEKAVWGARLALFKTKTVLNVSNSIDEIYDEISKRMETYIDLLDECKYKEARHEAIGGLHILIRARWRGVDITDLINKIKYDYYYFLSCDEIIKLGHYIND